MMLGRFLRRHARTCYQPNTHPNACLNLCGNHGDEPNKELQEKGRKFSDGEGEKRFSLDEWVYSSVAEMKVADEMKEKKKKRHKY